MTGAKEANIIFLPNKKTIMMKFIRSRLENVMKSKVMKKHDNLPLQTFQMYSRA